jgi:hypothetical protein
MSERPGGVEAAMKVRAAMDAWNAPAPGAHRKFTGDPWKDGYWIHWDALMDRPAPPALAVGYKVEVDPESLPWDEESYL